MDASSLPTHIATVARRLQVVGNGASADTFLMASYIGECLIKTVAICLLGGIRKDSPAVARKLEYELVRADGLGTWDKVIGECTGQSYVGYVDADCQPLIAWLTKKRTQADDEWARHVAGSLSELLNLLGAADVSVPTRLTVRFLIGQLVQIRNKTKAHGAVGPDFFADANERYSMAIALLLRNCPISTWEWYHLSMRQSKQNVRAIRLAGLSPVDLRASEAEFLRPTGEGIHFRVHPRGHIFHCGPLIRTNRECTTFTVPNGGYTGNGDAEFLDYGSGRTETVHLPQYLQPPAPLPASATEGASAIEIFSNVFGNLPPAPVRYVARPRLEQELSDRLRDRNHPIVTLHGRGGIGKTSLALQMAHLLCEEAEAKFEYILWLSARDLELRPSGATEVRRAIAGLDNVCRLVGALLETEQTVEGFAHLLQDPAHVTSTGILFIFDNFETLDDPREVHRFLDTHTHLPNKILITSRERAFKGDYPIEVAGMEYEEAERLLRQEALSLGVSLTPTRIQEVIDYTDAHPYVMRVVLGEMAKEGAWIPLKSLVPKRAELLGAVFERSFNKLSPDGRWAFLCVANWRSTVPELALLVTLGNRDLDAEDGLEECVRLALLARQELADGTFCYSAPELARLFAKKKLDGDPDRLLILEDMELLRQFGPLKPSEAALATTDQLIGGFVRRATERPDVLTVPQHERIDAILSRIAELWPTAWLSLAKFRKLIARGTDDVSYALRRAVEEMPYDKAAWLERANFAHGQGDEATRIAALVSAVEADPRDLNLLREVAFHLCKYVDAHKSEIPAARRGVYLKSVRVHMERLAADLDATGLSRLGWLFLLEGDEDGAWKYANLGLARDPTNEHCYKIAAKLDAQGYRPPHSP
jgi:hypothetical protein